MENIIVREKGASSEILKDKYNLDLEGIQKWLQRKTILSSSDTLISFTDLNDWHRKGAETYFTSFQIKYRNVYDIIKEKQIVIKAIITLPPEKHLQDWSNRRKLLQENGLNISNWYFYGQGVIIEDFYPNDYKSTKDFRELIIMADTLDKLGFNTINFLNDVRCNSLGRPHYIDFGYDLGEFSYFRKDVAIQRLKATYPNRVDDIDNFLNS
ncbi:hypothetical protein ACE193_09325 [Bernardetia sp. OM2101]|uniref:hypothetical protein n=1 Tax=Bernardetia sp. OM2101 TaxID=3344876 RepID=UPI0035CEDD2F